jgi:hypothetical protein
MRSICFLEACYSRRVVGIGFTDLEFEMEDYGRTDCGNVYKNRSLI